MKKLCPGLVVGFVCATGLCGTAAAADYAGDWEMKAGGKTLLILHLKPAASGWRGELVTPKTIAWYPSGRTIAVSDTQIVREPVEKADELGDRLTVRIQKIDGSSDVLGISLVDTDHASLTQTGKNLASMSLVRAAPGDQPATDWLARHTYNIDELRPSNQRLAEIFEADQAIRKTDNPNAQDWLASDQARRTETAELLRRAQLHTAIDFWRAAFIFQHGGAPGDYLLAHTLALISVKKGYPEAVWIAAATLDRYLQAMKQSQIYGTQYRWTADAPDVSQEPFDKDLISDALRAELGVPPLDAQKANGAILKPMAKSMQKDEIKH